MTHSDDIFNIQSFMKDLNVSQHQHYLIVEKSFRPEFQLRGSGSETLSFLTRKPYLLIVLPDRLLVAPYSNPLSKQNCLSILFQEIINFSIEKLTPFSEYCISFKTTKHHYFYLDSEDGLLDQLIVEKSESLHHFESLLKLQFYGLLT